MSIYRGPVVGVKFRKKEFDEAFDFLQSKDEETMNPEIKLIAEPENKYDKNAIAVHMGQDEQFWHVGYIPKDCTIKLHKLGLDKVEVDISKFNEFDGEVVGVDIEVTERSGS